VPPVAGGQAELAIEAAFGQPVDVLFAEFERTPFAAASVAQVHRARLPDGTVVAVKVRRPGIVQQVGTDLRLLRRAAALAQVVLPALRRQRPLHLIDELGTQLQAEIDLKHEARNARRLQAAIGDQPSITMPRWIDPLVSQDGRVQAFSQ